MFGKGSKVYSILGMKCPSCHEGDLFKSKGAYSLKKMADMHERCPKCNQNYNPEPNFYYGAMYISYMYSVAVMVAVLIVSWGIFDLGIWTTVGILTFLLLALTPYLFRLSRSTYINIFIHFKKNK